MAVATLLVGFWVTARIEETVVRNSANASALFMESFIAPLSQDLANQRRMSRYARREFESLFRDTALGERVISYKIWARGGRIAEASDPDLVDRIFEPDDKLKLAWSGKVGAEFEELGGEESAAERKLGLPLLEVYTPIREQLSGRVIAVAEFYEINEQLAADLADARLNSWLAVAAVMLGIGATLFVIVLRGSRTIDRARQSLNQRMSELSAMSDANQRLRMRVQVAAARAAEMNERAMRRIGADLHDGPAQHLGFAALKLDALREKPDSAAAEAVSDAIQEALKEIRQISRGLAAPEIDDLAPREVVETAIQSYEARTDAKASVDFTWDASTKMTPAVRICLFRFVQEGLNNIAKHAGASGAHIVVAAKDGEVSVLMHDDGPGFGEGAGTRDAEGGLGLAGLRDRVESLGGSFEFGDREQGGGQISMNVKMDAN